MRMLLVGFGLGLIACGSNEGATRSAANNSGGGARGDASVSAGGASNAGGASGNAGSPLLPDCKTGGEGCPCYGNGTCNSGLTCASELCVKLNAGGAGGIGSGAASGSGGKAVRETGGVSSAGGAGGALSAGGFGGSSQCSTDGTVCSNDPGACCVGLICVVDNRSPTNGTCEKLCTRGSDCSTGCCSPLTGSSASACAPSQYCAPSCRQVSSPCLDDPSSCCSGTLCAYDDPSETSASCAAVCLENLDCLSNCCAPLGSGNSVCSDPVYCGTGGSCLPAGTRPCGLGTDCCPGSYCISDSINQICLPTCFQNTDCSTGCCAAPNGNGIFVCTDPAYCP